MATQTVAIIGAGRVGSSLGFLLNRAGYPVTALASRTLSSAERAAAFIGSGQAFADAAQAAMTAEVVLLTTPDGVIRTVCDAIAQAGGFRQGALVIHTSGAHTRNLLDSAGRVGAFRAVIHPLQAIPNRERGVQNIPGSYFRIEADGEALQSARDLVRALGGIELEMPGWREDEHSPALYHAGAVVVSNFFVALVDYGLRIYGALGADKKEALKAVLPLIRGTLANIESSGIPDALTGPIARGDAETVRAHVDALEKRAPELLGLYRELAEHTIMVAQERQALLPEVLQKLREAVERDR
jgi:predicted short-subunit dehydrogenase-like oxidoreductase (DUF2520 family)